MPISVKNFGKMVDDVLDRIIAANVGFTSKAPGSVLRTIVEAIVAELDILYYQLQYEYNIMDIDNASGGDLERSIKILNVTRNPATYCTGTVTARSSVPVAYDIPIPKGYIVSTRKDARGNIIEFVVDNDYIFTKGTTSCDIGVIAKNPGRLILSPGQLCVMNIPIMGILTMSNDNIIDGGTEIESDSALRARAKLALPGLGKATEPALESAIRSIPGVLQVMVTDQARGVATTDISVVYSTIPVPQDIKDSIDTIVRKTKASGVSVNVVYPTIQLVNIDISLVLSDGADIQSIRNSAGDAILSYFNSLVIGETFIVKRMESAVITSNKSIVDMSTTTPNANIPTTTTVILRPGTITIDGQVWSNE